MENCIPSMLASSAAPSAGARGWADAVAALRATHAVQERAAVVIAARLDGDRSRPPVDVRTAGHAVVIRGCG